MLGGGLRERCEGEEPPRDSGEGKSAKVGASVGLEVLPIRRDKRSMAWIASILDVLDKDLREL